LSQDLNARAKLGGLERFTDFAEKRSVCVPEAVPGNERQLEGHACGAKLAPEKVLWVEWCLFAGRENEIVGSGLP
jgi:hypothetical protein